jgi:prepilin-type N-terminal cleavage/methylation domain-containing protein
MTMIRNRTGFTVIELLITMVIGSVLATIVSQGVGSYMRRRSLDDSRAAVIHMAARARSLAMERGSASLSIDPNLDTVTLVQGTDTVDVLMIETEYGADLTAAQLLTICYSPRGFALAACTNFTANQTLKLTFHNESANLLVRPLGQVEVM